MRLRHLVVLCAALALTVGAATAFAGGGNSANAKKCQKGGWQSLYRSNGTAFASESACVSYAAQGGTLTSTKITAYTFAPTSLSVMVGVRGTGFTPNHSVTLTPTGQGPFSSIFDYPGWTTDGSGAFDSAANWSNPPLWALFSGCRDNPQTIHITATDGVHSAATDITVTSPTC